ncbi:MAG: aspartyl/asparaginyl beta-hydroxylase domain-containing protein [Planctomycetota bacterium]
MDQTLPHPGASVDEQDSEKRILSQRTHVWGLKLVSRLVTARWRRRSGRTGPARSPHEAQRPHFYFPGLTAQPWWDPAEHPWIAELEAAAPKLRAELEALLADGFLSPRPIETIAPEERDLDERLIRSGAWHLYRLFYNGIVLEENCRRCPEATRVFRRIPGFTGTVGFAVLAPGTHVTPHCGASNAKLRCHLGLSVPADCGIRVGGEARTWVEDRCILFDDSFEHEVWNRGERPRYVFLIDIHHPELTGGEVAWLEKVSRFVLRLAPRRLRTPLKAEPRNAR